MGGRVWFCHLLLDENTQDYKQNIVANFGTNAFVQLTNKYGYDAQEQRKARRNLRVCVTIVSYMYDDQV